MPCESTENHWIIHIKSVNFVKYELYLNKSYKTNYITKTKITKQNKVGIKLHIVLPSKSLQNVLMFLFPFDTDPFNGPVSLDSVLGNK